MSSHLDNTNDANENQVFSSSSGDQFRTVFFDQSKRVTSNSHEDSTHIKRARLDSNIQLQQTAHAHAHAHAQADADAASVSDSPASPSTPAAAQADDVVTAAVSELQMSSLATFQHDNEHPSFVSTPSATDLAEAAHLRHHLSPHEPSVTVTPTTTAAVSPKAFNPVVVKRKRTSNKNSNSHLSHKIRKFRSRSLPNINYTSRSTFEFCAKIKPTAEQVSTVSSTIPSNKNSSNNTTSSHVPPPLPPVNIQSLREIDLTEILKNPQLRHDILFDPQLQFRPNLDGERGRRKKITYDKYWSGVRDEIEAYHVDYRRFNAETSRLPNLFTTLKEILISLLPSKDKPSVMEVLDIELILQQLSNNSVDFVELAKWLSEIFKSHCAPMRDSWVDDMMNLFLEADAERSVNKLVEGLRWIFTILEAMKLDVANHQIRILRPVLVQTAVDFERDYFMQMISRCKLDISDSISWFKRYHQKSNSTTTTTTTEIQSTPRCSIVPAILSLLSCSKMVSEFPSSLAFDHARLIVLRANVRQVVCLQLCVALYRQMVSQTTTNTVDDRTRLLSNDSINNLKKEILAIITDDNGNVKWTRNIGAIALQLTRRSAPHESLPKDSSVEFAVSWLIKQTQPSATVYALMEQRVFGMITTKVSEIESVDDSDKMTSVMPVAGSSTVTSASSSTNTVGKEDDEEDDLTSIASRIALLTKFHWSVFGSYYTQALN